MSERRGGNLPDLDYFLNNGRDDVTREELTELLTVIGKASFAKNVRKGGDGAELPVFAPAFRLECDESDAEPFPGFGEGSSLEEFGLAGSRIVPEPATDAAETEEAGPTVGTAVSESETEERPDCEGRVRKPWESSLWDDFDDDQPDYPDDRECL